MKKGGYLKLAGAALFAVFALQSCRQGGEAKKEMDTASATTKSSDEYTTVSYFTMNSKGELERPENYRTWVFVGTPVTPNDLNNGKAPFPEMHNVYIDPVSYEHYKETGKFREGTILVKELVSVGSTAAVSGKGYFMGEFIGLEASVKSKEHFPDEPGNWAIFSFTSPSDGILKDTSPKLPVASCVACHDANAEDDFVFTQYYPVLRAAKGAGKNTVPENTAERVAEADL
ncbi:cytochrome P460 family protein [Galbibacter mesophilus]|uniref:cytochrome P460 family protein n=1 Tax=Galbibacter mesophilus TaxID=379069 RepID=UPI00191DCBC1|nr:cytochrome P460 family protein [Galbibacter mesophilus]MCM5662203.1 cytochrome P460 family protein [Galbibacter mesophilus]